jgi:hypothetical protein
MRMTKKFSRAVYYVGWRALYVSGLLNGNNSIYCGANDGTVERNPIGFPPCLYIGLTCGIQDKFPGSPSCGEPANSSLGLSFRKGEVATEQIENYFRLCYVAEHGLLRLAGS